MISKDKQKEFYDEIMKLYDFADNVVGTIEVGTEEEQYNKFKLATPVLENMNIAADTMADCYLNLVESNGKVSRKDRKELEKSIRVLFFSAIGFMDNIDKVKRV